MAGPIGARGGLINAPYPWGVAAANASRCDFEGHERFAIVPMRKLPPNGYGLYAMSSDVWTLLDEPLAPVNAIVACPPSLHSGVDGCAYTDCAGHAQHADPPR